ncbi:MAG TPA: M28 family peptidase [Blastocatellia bacterium]|nr:M28 family peptidase [Blastocatellia bacterium]
MNKQPKRRLRKWLVIANLVLWSVVALALFSITQPMFVPMLNSESQFSVSAERLKTHVQTLSETFAPRDYTNVVNLDRTAAYIKHEFEQTNGRVSEQPYKVNGESYRNVIARFGKETNERIVIGAHYDVCQPLPGADDNASGVAGLIELAHLFGKSELPMTVELVAYTLEEPPFFRSEAMGSAVHVAVLKQQGIAVRAMLSLEMIGYFSDEPGSQKFPNPILKLLYPSRGNFIAIVGNFGQIGLVRKVKRAMRAAALLPVHSINAPGWLPGIDFSDHLNYWRQGYPAVMITDTSFYRNENYHTAQDTLEKLDYNRMAKVVQAVYGAILDLSR